MPADLVFLYDGHCRLCRNGAAFLARMTKPAALELRDFQLPGALEAFPQVTYAECMKAAQLVTPGGLAWSGLEAVVRALASRPLLGFLTGLYSRPVIRRCADAIYRWVARNRYRFMGRAQCTDGSCALHLQPASRPDGSRSH